MGESAENHVKYYTLQAVLKLRVILSGILLISEILVQANIFKVL
jgi:hypothetical protein